VAVDATAVVFDAEPLIAHADDDPGAATTAACLDAVAANDVDGRLTRVNATEIRYVLAGKYDVERADRYLQWLSDVGITPVGAEELWTTAADWILAEDPSLADAYALAAAEVTGGTLLVGADDDFESIDTLAIERIREGGA
jgi:predicted nucleic acid-binding protein